MPLVDVGFTQMNRRTETLSADVRRSVLPDLATEIEVAAQRGTGHGNR